MMDKSKLAGIVLQAAYSACFILLMWQLVEIQKAIDYNTKLMGCYEAIKVGVDRAALQKQGCFK